MQPFARSIPDSFDPLRSKSFSREKLLCMADAGISVVNCIRMLHERGSNLVNEVLRGSSDFTEWEHYPSGDVSDPHSHSQYYFHAHSLDDRAIADYGHFHIFMRPNDIPLDIRLAGVDTPLMATATNHAPTHLIAISMSPAGMPERLFTTNRWVTGETWCDAAQVTAMLDRFSIEVGHPSRLVNQWLTAMLVLFRPQIETLLVERDRAIREWRACHPDIQVLEDRRMEITSYREISLLQQIEWLDKTLETKAVDEAH